MSLYPSGQWTLTASLSKLTGTVSRTVPEFDNYDIVVRT